MERRNGAPPSPIAKIASGGELSRFLLALKVCLAKVGDAPTIVFDEVDSGIGGAVAAAVGERLVALAKSAQVLVVTHSPQVASLGDEHYKVIKEMSELSNKTNIIKLSSDDKLRRNIGKNGKLKYLKYFNSTLVAEYIVEKTLGINSKKKYMWEIK